MGLQNKEEEKQEKRKKAAILILLSQLCLHSPILPFLPNPLPPFCQSA